MRFDDNYEELIDRAVSCMDSQRFKEAWEAISQIPDAVKINDFAEECCAFAAIALVNGKFNELLLYYKAYLNTVEVADHQYVEELTSFFFDITTMFDSSAYPYVYKLIEMVTRKFRTPGVLHICGSVYDMLDKPEKGLPLLEEALDLDPFNKKIWWEKVFCYHAIGDKEKEVECCNYYLALEPECNDYVIKMPIANTLVEAQQFDEAIQMMQQVVDNRKEMSENRAGACTRIAEVYKMMDDQPHEIEYRKKALKLAPDDPDYISMMVQYYITTENKPSKGKALVIKALEKNPDDPLLIYMYAAVECQLFVKSGHKADLAIAEEYVQKAIEKMGENSQALMLATRIYLLKEDYKNGLSFAKRAYKVDPNHQFAILYLVIAYLGCGKMTEFRRFYRIYAKLDPDARQNVISVLPQAEKVIDRLEEYDRRHKKD